MSTPRGRLIAWLGAALPALAVVGTCHGQSVLGYHGGADRAGNFVVPSLTWERARNIHLDPSFHPGVSGHVYAQPLYWQPPRSPVGVLLVATEDDRVHAIDARSGDEIWTRALGQPIPLWTQPCGNIDPLGITGTPVIDAATQAIYLDAAARDTSGPHHRIFALSLKDGALLPGWPIDVAEALAARGQRFNTRFQNQRGALAIVDGRSPMAGTLAIAGITAAGSSVLACALPATSSVGARADVAAASGRRAGSAVTVGRCLSLPAIRLMLRHGVTARPSSA
jgi:hypothetical protein